MSEHSADRDSRGNGHDQEPGGREMIDWGIAVSTAQRLVRPGPRVTLTEARDVVSDLHRYADTAQRHVQDFTGLEPQGTAPVLVVDRPGWVRANADAFGVVLAPLAERIGQRRPEGPGGGMASSVGRRLTGVEAGALLAFLSGKVLGQFDPFWEDGSGAGGRLLLVAPNVVHVERELGVDPADFRLWVCLHEETHRVQFLATPWLRAYMRSQIKGFLDQADLDPSAMAAQLRGAFEQLLRVLRGESGASVLDVVQSPGQKEILDRLTAVMSLLEGHADVVMDGVGPDVVPSVATIREKFQRRRSGGSVGDHLLQRLLGLDAKLRQYRDGAAFVRRVLERVGTPGLNKVWERPENLPSREEITDPDAWVRRVHGLRSLPTAGVPEQRADPTSDKPTSDKPTSEGGEPETPDGDERAEGA